MILGITGGVGSGKSTVLNYLREKYSAFIIEADIVAKEIMMPGNSVYNDVIKAFPDLTLREDKQINREQLARIVFEDPKKLELLNSITHPGVKNEILEMIHVSDNNLIVIEAALLLEEHYDAICDEIWYVYCEQNERISRLYQSRGYSQEKSLSIIANQMSEEEFRKRTDHLIDNSFDSEKTFRQIDDLLNNKR